MSQYFQIHPDNPQTRLIHRVVEILRDGGVIAYPTDSTYALGCMIGEKTPVERIRRIRNLDKAHNFSVVCSDLSEIATYAKVNNSAYRLMKSLTPGPYTFVLRATGEVPRRLMHAKRKNIGIRIPENTICQAIVSELGEPLLSSTLKLPGQELPMVDPEEMRETLQNQIDLVVDGGYCGIELTSVIDLVSDVPKVVREGKGDIHVVL